METDVLLTITITKTKVCYKCEELEEKNDKYFSSKRARRAVIAMTVFVVG